MRLVGAQKLLTAHAHQPRAVLRRRGRTGERVQIEQTGKEAILGLKRKFMSCSHCQGLGQLTDLASNWLFTLVQPIRRQHAC